jgi:hypothetical protein
MHDSFKCILSERMIEQNKYTYHMLLQAITLTFFYSCHIEKKTNTNNQLIICSIDI